MPDDVFDGWQESLSCHSVANLSSRQSVRNVYHQREFLSFWILGLFFSEISLILVSQSHVEDSMDILSQLQPRWPCSAFHLVCPEVLLSSVQLLSRVQLFATSWTVTQQAPLSMRILQARTLEWATMPSTRRFSQLRDGTQLSCTAGRFFTIWAIREAQKFS